MRVLVLGAAGFLGTRFVRRLVADARIAGRRIDEMVLFDARAASVPDHAPMRVTQVQGDLRDAAVLDRLFEAPVDAVLHLAATLTLDAESDFARGLQTNVLGLVELLERCRRARTAPMLLFASSISTFGGKLPETVDDDVFQAPGTSYGTHKAVAELLLADYSRHGYIDGRALRLPIVLTHPGPASGSISDQVAALIREPLRGQPTACRMQRDSRMAVASVDKVVDSFLHLAALPADALQAARIMNLPGLTVTPAQLVEAVDRHQPGAGARVTWAADAKVQAILDAWPRVFTSRRALALGFTPDAGTDALVASFLAAETTR
ncbi:MAG TPA: NAD-dependent epimerase/dehydratase family protein [Ramlibacter sp.]|jgi:nucleoside-diphosphate-sugar epimerase|nr:NAD-dependent epimerase/dehydratase family protein [Ramlibacter sp.]